MTNVLDQICDRKRKHIAARQCAVGEAALREQAQAQAAPRGFHRAIRTSVAAGRPALIAEIKKASPSKGVIRADFDPPALARAYRDAGASALSVLTDMPWFQGRDEYLVAARAAVELPALRKDFMLEPYQVLEARALGADCILLIMAALSPGEAASLHRLARDLGLDVLAEVHDPAELDQALALEGALLGVNNRDLRSLAVDITTFERLAAHAPRDAFLVAESGLATPADVARVAAAGARAILVGESLMRERDVAAATRALMAMGGRA